MRRPGLITRRNLIRAGLAAPFVLPKSAVAASLHAGSGRTFLGGARPFPPIPAGYTLNSQGFLVDGGGNLFEFLETPDGTQYEQGSDGAYLFGPAP